MMNPLEININDYNVEPQNILHLPHENNNAIQYSKWKRDGLRKMKVISINSNNKWIETCHIPKTQEINDTCFNTFNTEHILYTVCHCSISIHF